MIPRRLVWSWGSFDIRSRVTPRRVLPAAQTTMPQGTSAMLLSGIWSTTDFSLTSLTIVLVMMSILAALKVLSV